MPAPAAKSRLFTWLMRRFGPRFTVRVSPDAFIFASPKSTLQIGTFLYLKEHTGQFDIITVGEDAPVVPGVFRVDLFGNDRLPSTPAPGIGRMECLEVFCRYGIQKVSGRSIMVRPQVTIIGLDSLDAVLHGYQEAVLRQAFESTCASQVVFGDSNMA